MLARIRARFDYPILRLELRRIRRRRWWPGKRLVLCVVLLGPVLLGLAVAYGVVLATTDFLQREPVAAVALGVPVVCLPGMVVWLLSLILPWIAPALTAGTIARERELGTLDLLRATLLTERGIVLGKLMGCLAWLWPGIVALVALAPFQLVRMAGGGLFVCPSSDLVSVLAIVTESGVERMWLWLVVSILAACFRPLSDLAFNAAVGLFVSALARTPGMAVAASYGAILVVRIALWLAPSLVYPALLLSSYDFLASPGVWGDLLAGVSGVFPLAVVFAEIVAAGLLVWGAVLRLRRG